MAKPVLKARQGATYIWVFAQETDGVPVPFAGLPEARFQAAPDREGTPAVLDLSTAVAGSGLVIDRDAGEITLTLSATVTKALAAELLHFDLEIFEGEVLEPVADGFLIVLPEVAP